MGCSDAHAGKVEVTDLAAHRVAPLARGAPIPQRIVDGFSGFDALDEAPYGQLQQEAAALPAVFGVAVNTAG
eukprot:785191-Lingulodinium_polyedra.AAC.1